MEYIDVYIYLCVCVCVCALIIERDRVVFSPALEGCSSQALKQEKNERGRKGVRVFWLYSS